MLFIPEKILPKMKNGKCVINLDEYKSVGSHWIANSENGSNVTCFDGFRLEYIPKRNFKFIGNISTTTNICRIQAYDSIMFGYFCIGFIDFMLSKKSWQILLIYSLRTGF